MDPFSLFLLWFLFGCRNGGGGSIAPVPSVPGGQPGWPGSPISYTPPWPQAVPTTELPKFPGSGWEFDEPPPPAVQQRARQLVDQLWKAGSGAHRIEQTAGRWIAYQSQVVSSGKKGVVAYRQKGTLPSAPAPVLTASRTAPRPAAPRPAPARAPSPVSTPAPRVPPSAPAPAVMPAVAPSPAVNLPVLQRGAGIKPKPPSPNVKVLQQRLGIAADGQFGKDTDAAVRAFQARNGLDVDGIVGPKTWTALFAVSRA